MLRRQRRLQATASTAAKAKGAAVTNDEREDSEVNALSAWGATCVWRRCRYAHRRATPAAPAVSAASAVGAPRRPWLWRQGPWSTSRSDAAGFAGTTARQRPTWNGNAARRSFGTEAAVTTIIDATGAAGTAAAGTTIPQRRCRRQAVPRLRRRAWPSPILELALNVWIAERIQTVPRRLSARFALPPAPPGQSTQQP